MSDCIFCKIVNHELPCFKVYEDELVLAFLNINPVTDGHTLIIPKKHYENIFEIDEETIERVGSVSKKIALKMKEVLNIDSINIFQSNGESAEQEIMHYHMHLIPRKDNDNFRINNCLCPKKVSQEELETILNKIKL
jgi:histidine triad (HIT) family protein